MIRIKNGIIYYKPRLTETPANRDFTIRISLGKQYKEIYNNREFIKSLDKLLDHLFSTLPLWKEPRRNHMQISYIERARMDLYEETMETIIETLGSSGIPLGKELIRWDFLPDDTNELSSEEDIHLN